MAGEKFTRSQFDGEANDRNAKIRKAAMLSALIPLVQAELAKNPQYNISHKALDELLKNNPEAFPSINSGRSIMNSFDGINNLRKLLGLPEKRERDFL